MRSLSPIKLIVLVAFLLVSLNSFAQPGDPGGDPDVPITGLELLLGGGALLGVRKLLNRNSNKSK
jgi:hypothetical protein